MLWARCFVASSCDGGEREVPADVKRQRADTRAFLIHSHPRCHRNTLRFNPIHEDGFFLFIAAKRCNFGRESLPFSAEEDDLNWRGR